MRREFCVISILFGYDHPRLERIRRDCAELHFVPLLTVCCVITFLGTPAALLLTLGLISRKYSSVNELPERI